MAFWIAFLDALLRGTGDLDDAVDMIGHLILSLIQWLVRVFKRRQADFLPPDRIQRPPSNPALISLLEREAASGVA